MKIISGFFFNFTDLKVNKSIHSIWWQFFFLLGIFYIAKHTQNEWLITCRCVCVCVFSSKSDWIFFSNFFIPKMISSNIFFFHSNFFFFEISQRREKRRGKRWKHQQPQQQIQFNYVKWTHFVLSKISIVSQWKEWMMASKKKFHEILKRKIEIIFNFK